MRVFFTTPPYNLLENAYGMSKGSVDGFEPPLGLAYLAAVLRAGGHEVHIYDPLPVQGSAEDCRREAEAFRPDVIGLSVISCLWPQAAALAHKLRAHLPRVPLLVGGPHCFYEPKTPLARCGALDVSVAGEAEDRILDILAALGRPEALARVPGIAWRDGDTIRYTGDALPPRDLDSVPFPARDLLPPEGYGNLPYLKLQNRTAWMIASRGCPYRKCTFCYQSRVQTPGFRTRSPRDVLAEVRELVAQGYNDVTFLDECFVGDRRWVEALCRLFIAEGPRFEWSCQTRVNNVTPAILELMRQAGCYNIYYGIESGVPELLRIMNKGITPAQTKKAVRAAQAAGLEVVGSFILGLPGDTPARAEQTARFAVELDLDYAIFHFFHPESGMPIIDTAARMGRILALDHPDFARVNYLPAGYRDVREVERTLTRAYRRFYLRPGYVLKRLRRIRSLPELARNVKGAAIMFSR